MATYSSELTDEMLGPAYFKQKARMAASKQASTARHSMKTINCSLLFCAILSALIGLGYILFDPIVKHIVLRRLVLRDNSEFAQIWENPPITPHLKVYFFNLTNPKEFFAGTAKPVVEEVGPYTYHQKWIKENVKWHDNGTMSYQTRKEFTFIPELSVGNHAKDNITTLNVPAISALYQMRHSSYFYKFGLETILYGLNYNTWITKTPEELIWGYAEPLFDLAKVSLPNPPALDKFGFFVKKNDSDDLPTYTMFTGEGNPYNLSKISLFNGKDSLDIWKDQTCNQVQGSDGATFNPYIHKTDTLWFFNDQLCRSLPMVFDQEVMSRNLPGYRFTPRHDVFRNTGSEYNCFCDGEELCSMIGDGMFAVSKCQFDAPVILSWPHFLHANDTFQQSVKGLQPDSEKHGFWFDVQQTTGTTLSAKARIQINLAVKHIPEFGAMSKVNNTVVPLLWFEEGLDELGPELLDVIGKAVLDPPVMKNYVLCVLFGMGTATMVIGWVALIRCVANKLKKDVYGCSPSTHYEYAVDPEKVTSILKQQPSKKKGHAHQSSVGSGKFLLASEGNSSSSSRATSASHSRNSSTGSGFNAAAAANNLALQEEEQQNLLNQLPPQV